MIFSNSVLTKESLKSFSKIALAVAVLSKSDLYLTLEAYINTQMIEIPNDKGLINELVSLERRRGRSGRDTVDHPPRGRDDRSNVIAGLAYEGMKKRDFLFPKLRCGVDYGELSADQGTQG